MRENVCPVAIGVLPQDNGIYAGNSAWLRKGPRRRNHQNKIARIEGAQRVPTGVNSVLGGRKIIWLYIIRTPGATLETGAKTEHGRPEQNTNARQLSERKGSGGTVQVI